MGIILMLSTHVLADDTTAHAGPPTTVMSDAAQTTTNMLDSAQSPVANAVVMTAQPVTQTNTPPAPPVYVPPTPPAQPYYAPPPRKQTRGPFQHVKNFFKSLAGME